MVRNAPSDLGDFFSGAIRELCQEILHDSKIKVSHESITLDSVIDEFSNLRLSEDDKDRAKLRGAIFTPSWLAKRVVRNAISYWKKTHRQDSFPTVVGDVSCGIGAFLANFNGYNREGIRMIGQDIDILSIQYAKLLMLML